MLNSDVVEVMLSVWLVHSAFDGKEHLAGRFLKIVTCVFYFET